MIEIRSQNSRRLLHRVVGETLAGADLADLNLFRANLPGQDLRGARLAKTSLREAILSGADPIESMQGKVLTNGRLNAYRTLRALIGGEPNSISGTVFDDADHDGTRGAKEAGVAGVRVFLDANDNGRADEDDRSYASTNVPLPIPGGPAEYEHFKATVGSLIDATAMDFRGASVTIPHKENLLRFVRERGGRTDQLSEQIGAAT